jgi:hypothetical protein
VIVLLHAPDPGFVKEASKRGIFAQIGDSDVEDWQSSIDIVLRRFAEYQDLEGAIGRRALGTRLTLNQRPFSADDGASTCPLYGLFRSPFRSAGRRARSGRYRGHGGRPS